MRREVASPTLGDLPLRTQPRSKLERRGVFQLDGDVAEFENNQFPLGLYGNPLLLQQRAVREDVSQGSPTARQPRSSA